MFCNEKHEIITDADLLVLSKFVSAPHILLNCKNIIYMNSSCSSLFCYDSFDIQKPIKTDSIFIDENFVNKIHNIYNSNTGMGLIETLILTSNNKIIFINLECKVVFDNLKRINDCYGHFEGDSVILKISDELKKLANENDVLARIGGDEFLGLFFDQDINNIFTKIKNSLINISNTSNIDNQGISYSFSFGISSFGEDGQEFKELFKKADERMYSIKNHKENALMS